MKRLLFFMLSAAVVAACDSRLKKENERLEEEIAERRDSLEVLQQRELASARLELARTDSMLAAVSRQHDDQHEWVMSHSTELNDQSPEVLQLNKLRARRDSLRVEFEKQAHKIKFFIRKIEQKEDGDGNDE